MNPMDMMQIAGRINIFKQQHPKFGMFLSKISGDGIKEGDVLEIKYKSVEDKEIVSNIKLTNDDIESFDMLKELRR